MAASKLQSLLFGRIFDARLSLGLPPLSQKSALQLSPSTGQPAELTSPLISPRASAADIHTMPDVFAAVPLGSRSSSQIDQSLRRRCALDGARGLRLYVPAVCGANALASLVLCCCAAVAVVVSVGVVAVRALSIKNGEAKWGRRPFKDRREDL